MLIRREQPDDALAIRNVHNTAFATRDGSPAPEAVLVDKLREAGDSIPELSLVAEFDGAVVGHVLGSLATIDRYPSLAIGPVGVMPAHQRRGVGSALMHAVLGAADALDFPEAVLLGDPDWYRRFGFQLAEACGVHPPDPAWAGHFQVRTLTAWTSRRQGTFRYARAFDDVG